LAEGLAEMPGIKIALESVQTNIVRFDVGELGHTTASFIKALAARGIKASSGAAPSGVRMVVHRHIDDAAIDEALSAIRDLNPTRTPVTASGLHR
jgi:threonine aldolase